MFSKTWLKLLKEVCLGNNPDILFSTMLVGSSAFVALSSLILVVL